MKSRQRMVDTLPNHDDMLLAGSDDDYEPLTEEQRAAVWDDTYWERIDAEVRYFGGVR
ncbi:hypothetical protein AB4Y32_16200 [Paraburkholderia phymatum]|uniref:Uncharacterized protein n=1 Tax=Paraburkholderia phymatum TaxID=148447 RepID=A0ACC6U160_9BURK